MSGRPVPAVPARAARWSALGGNAWPAPPLHPGPPGAPRFPASLWAPPSGKGRLGRAGYRGEAEPMGWDPAGDVRVDRGPSHLVDAFWNANSDSCHRCPPTASACHLGPESCSECALPLSSCATPKERLHGSRPGWPRVNKVEMRLSTKRTYNRRPRVFWVPCGHTVPPVLLLGSLEQQPELHVDATLARTPMGTRPLQVLCLSS